MVVVPKMGAVVPKSRKVFRRRFEREIGKQSSFFRAEFDSWVGIINGEYDKVLKHLRFIKRGIAKIDQGEVFERLMPWILIAEAGRRILSPAELRMYLHGARYSLQMAGLEASFSINNPLYVEAARLRAASLVTFVSDAARKNLHDLTVQGIETGWSVDTLAMQMRGHLTALPVSQRRIMREAADRLAAGVSQGKVDAWAAREMTKMTNYRAFMISRTEASAAMNDGALIGYRQAGVKQVEWLAQIDACDVCESFAGELYPVDSMGMIPEHPNCLCSWAPVITPDFI